MINTLKKVVLVIVAVICLSGLVGGVIGISGIWPLIVYAVLAYMDLKTINVQAVMLVLSGIMMLVNLTALSFVDVLIWVVIFGLYLAEGGDESGDRNSRKADLKEK